MRLTSHMRTRKPKRRVSRGWISICLCFVLCLTALPVTALGAAAAAPVVRLSSQNLTVDGVDIICEKYNIDGWNYFKLRDLAWLLNGTPSQFAVGWDRDTATVMVLSGLPYTPNGSELAMGTDRSASAAPTVQTILINGEARRDLSVYNIGGNNYFQLRQLGSILGFTVDYDGDSETTYIYSRPEAASIQLNREVLALDRGTSAQLAARVLPEQDGGWNIHWSSNNPEVATVNSSGYVTALSGGIAVITAAVGGQAASCTVSVTAVDLLSLDNTELQLFVGGSARLTALPQPEPLSTAVVWTSSNPEVAIVDQTGLVTAKGNGSVEITAAVGGKTASCLVTVSTRAEISALYMDYAVLHLDVGEIFPLAAMHFPTTAAKSELYWFSGDPDVATVNASGVVSGTGYGKTDIIAVTENGKSASCRVFVTNPSGRTPVLVSEPDDSSGQDSGNSGSNNSGSGSSANNGSNNSNNNSSGNNQNGNSSGSVVVYPDYSYTVPVLNREYGPLTLTRYYAPGDYWTTNWISSLVFTGVDVTTLENRYLVSLRMQGITDDNYVSVLVCFYNAVGQVVGQEWFTGNTIPNVPYDLRLSQYVDKDVLHQATSIGFLSYSGYTSGTWDPYYAYRLYNAYEPYNPYYAYNPSDWYAGYSVAPVYSGGSGVPNFGYVVGVLPVLGRDDTYFYSYRDITSAGHGEDYTALYANALTRSGFEAVALSEEEIGSGLDGARLYRNPRTGYSVILSTTTLGNVAGILVTIR